MSGASKKSKRRRKRGGSARRPSRPGGRIYSLTPEIQALLNEAKRLFPRTGDMVRIGDLAPGCESVETVSQQLFGELRRRFDSKRLMLFCRLNAERLLDCIQQRIDEGAWPLDAQELLAEIYFRLHDDLLFRAGILPARRTTYAWSAPSGTAGTWEMLRCAADTLLDEQLKLLRARSIPLPGVPAPAVGAADEFVEQAAKLLASRGCRLERRVLLDWIAHAMMRLSAEDRRLLHQRDVLRDGFAEIAVRLRTTPFSAALRTREARLKLHDELTGLLATFQGERAPGTAPSNRSGPATGRTGRVLRGPGSRSGAIRAPAPSDGSTNEDDHEVDG